MITADTRREQTRFQSRFIEIIQRRTVLPTRLGQVGTIKCCQSLASDIGAGPDVHGVEDIKVPVTHPQGEVTVRLYTPEGTGPFPVHFNMHGGEFLLSDCPKTVIY